MNIYKTAYISFKSTQECYHSHVANCPNLLIGLVHRTWYRFIMVANKGLFAFFGIIGFASDICLLVAPLLNKVCLSKLAMSKNFAM